MTLAQVYCQAYARGFPHAAARDLVAELADAMFRLPTSRLTPVMLERLAEAVRDHEYHPRRDRTRAAAGRAAGCSERQRDQIRMQCCRMEWGTGMLARFLQRTFGVDKLRALTHDQAEECLARMRGMKDNATDRRLLAGGWHR